MAEKRTVTPVSGVLSGDTPLDAANAATLAAILLDTGTTLDDLVDDLETRLTAARAGYLDNLSGGAVALAASVGTLVNSGGTATLGGILGDVANSSIAARLTALAGYVDDLETRLTAARAGYLDNLSGGAVATATALAGAALSKDATRYVAVTADLTSATWNTDATHEVFTVTGLVRMRMWIECTSNVGSVGGTAVLMFGHESDTDAYIASTDETELDAGDLWYDDTPTTAMDTFGNVVMDYVVNGLDVGYEIDTEACNAGVLVFHCVWEPLNATGAVAAGDGSALV